MSSPLPGYWLTRPGAASDAAAPAAFDALLNTVAGTPAGAAIHYTLPWPKWQFLCHAADRHGLALHGSGNPAIAEFEPRKAQDLVDFGNQKAVYAAADGLWALFFAIVDRDRFDMSVVNACIRLMRDDDEALGPFYVFSVSEPAFSQQPWRDGTVYLLPRTPFVQQAPMSSGGLRVQIAQLASAEPVRPMARLAVTPADFPLLAQIRPHDSSRLKAYADALQGGLPWPE